MSVQLIEEGQASPEVPINENALAAGQAYLWSHDKPHDTGLVVGLNGGDFDANVVADSTVTCTDNTTNYIVVNRSTRVSSTSTSTTNWNNTGTYGRVARAVFDSGVLTFYDERFSSGGIFDHTGGVGGTVTSVGLALPAEFNVSGSPVTSAGTLTGAWANQAANLAFMGPDSGSAATPGFRAIVPGDLSFLDDDTTLAANSALRIPTQHAVKAYSDNLVTGLSWKTAVRARTTGALAANTYANGSSGVGATLTGNANGALAAQDGVTLVASDRLLVANEATASHNGLYIVTQVGDGSHPYILTRATDADQSGELVNATVFVSEGTTEGDTQWTCSTNAPITVGTTSITFVQVAGAGTYTSDGTTITLTGNSFSLTAGAVAVDTHAATGKTTPVDADEMPLVDSAASNALKKVTWANVKATLKTYLDTLYAALGAITSSGLTMATGKLLGRSTASTGAIEEIAIGTGLSLSGGTLSSTGLGGTVTATGTPASGNLTKFSGALSITNGDLSGDVTTSGTLAATIAAQAVTLGKLVNASAQYKILARKSTSAGSYEECSLSDILDFLTSAAQGDLLYRGSSGWAYLAPGTSGQFLQTQGASANPQWASEPYDVYVFLAGLQTSANQKLYRCKLARAVTFASNFSGSYFAASANAAGTTVFTVYKNGSSVGTISIASGTTTATFSTSGAVSFAAGDLMEIDGASTADTTLADIGITLVGTR